MNYENIRKNPKQFLALTSLKVEEFDDLLPYFSEEWEAYRLAYDSHGKLRPQGSRRLRAERGKLAKVEKKLFFTLYCLKTNPLEEALAASFDMNQPKVNKFKKILLPILLKTLKKRDVTPARTTQGLHDIIEREDISNVLLDGTERPVNRSVDDEIQKEHYSGKKKSHTVINNIVSGFDDRILFLGETFVGSKHEMGILKEESLYFPKGTNLWVDLGFQGFRPDGVLLMIGNKKPRKSKLTTEQKWFNQSLSRARVWVEHAIGAVKRLRMVKETLRCLKFCYRDMLMEIACGLHNFRISKRPEKKMPQLSCQLACPIDGKENEQISKA